MFRMISSVLQGVRLLRGLQATLFALTTLTALAGVIGIHNTGNALQLPCQIAAQINATTIGPIRQLCQPAMPKVTSTNSASQISSTPLNLVLQYLPGLYILILIWLLFKLISPILKGRSIGSILILLFTIYLVFENALLLYGNSMTHNALLYDLTLLDAWLLPLLSPFLIITSIDLAHRTQAEWIHRVFVRCVFYILTAAAMVAAVISEIPRISLIPIFINNRATYDITPSNLLSFSLLSPLASLLISGFGIWRKIHWPWLFLWTLTSILLYTYLGHIVLARNAVTILLTAAIISTDQRITRATRRIEPAIIPQPHSKSITQTQ